MDASMINRNARRLAVAALIAVSCLSLTTVAMVSGSKESERETVCSDSATLFRSARAVISKNQGLINDASRGDKGLSPDAVATAAMENYEKATGQPFPALDNSTISGQSQIAMLDAVRTVMSNAQPVINEQGKCFKGFLPAVFAKQVADAFNKNMNGKMSIKLTAPKDYVRNRANRPDAWESGVLEQKFRSGDWEKNRPFFESAQHKGKDAYRFILPEYYGESCLSCHGGPKGERDITGGKKEGGKLGELGGAISVTIFDDAFIASADSD